MGPQISFPHPRTTILHTHFQSVQCDFGESPDVHEVLEISVSTKDDNMSTSDGESTEDNLNVVEWESSEESISDSKETIVSLYIRGVSEKLGKVCIHLGVKPIFKPQNTLRNMLMHVKE